jgi:hypothetical protein
MGIKGLLKKNPKDDREEHIPPAKPAIRQFTLPTKHTLPRSITSETKGSPEENGGLSRRRGVVENLDR